MSANYNKGVVSFHLGPELHEQIVQECHRMGVSKSQVARFLFKRWLAAGARNRARVGASPVLAAGEPGGEWK